MRVPQLTALVMLGTGLEFILPSPLHAQVGGGATQTTTGAIGEALANETVAVRPQLGLISYDNQYQNGTADFALGFTADMNGLKYVNFFNLSPSQVFIGPEAGMIFSHLSSSSSNFYSIPANLKVAYMFTDRFRAGAHGGGNFIYRSTANAMRLSNAPQGVGSDLSLYGNLGLDLDYAISPLVALGVRPDLTFSSGNNLFTGTMTVTIPLQAV